MGFVYRCGVCDRLLYTPGEWDVGMGLQAACAWDDQQELPAKCTLHFLEITVRLRSFAPLIPPPIPPPTANDFVDHLGRAAPQTEGWRPSWIPTPKFPPTYLIGPNCNTSTRATTPMLTPVGGLTFHACCHQRSTVGGMLRDRTFDARI